MIVDVDALLIVDVHVNLTTTVDVIDGRQRGADHDHGRVPVQVHVNDHGGVNDHVKVNVNVGRWRISDSGD